MVGGSVGRLCLPASRAPRNLAPELAVTRPQPADSSNAIPNFLDTDFPFLMAVSQH